MSPGHVFGAVARMRRALLLAALAALALVCAAVVAPGASAASVQPTPLSTQAWHGEIARVATPGKGCFAASYPALTWHSVTCATAPKLRFIPSAGVSASTATAPAPDTVGNGWDYSAAVSGVLNGATGSFPTSPSCATASGNGDTHLETFGGTYYDFQAEGTFTLAQNANMTVQNEQVSGAPTWPTAAVNAAIGTQMGSDQVALCDSGAVYVDDAPASIASGSSVTLASGDTITRAGSVYTVADPQGDSVTATLNGSYANVSVGLGQYPETVRGLLANAPGTDNELETSTGAVLTTPVSLNTLYDVYGDSWRVAPTGSLVAVCDDPTANEDPTSPLWADTLTAAQQAKGEAVCQQDGVTDKTLFEACTLDVVVLGAQAATVYEGESAPVDVGFSEDTSGSGQSASPAALAGGLRR